MDNERIFNKIFQKGEEMIKVEIQGVCFGKADDIKILKINPDHIALYHAKNCNETMILLGSGIYYLAKISIEDFETALNEAIETQINISADRLNEVLENFSIKSK